jgi:hypothetical protein
MQPETRPMRGARSWVEWRAERIDDPISRLRYLRSVAPPRDPKDRRVRVRAGVLLGVVAIATASAFLVRAMTRVEPLPSHIRRIRPTAPAVNSVPDVWQVDKGADWEMYSNGLRIDTRYTIPNHCRSYKVFRLDRSEVNEENRRIQPVGIVFHTTESQQAPFEAGQNRVLKKVAESIVEFVRRHHAYNYLIDRFGRVYRIVREGDAAEHAGRSIWSDEEFIYLNLNESFLGVSFEAKTRPGQEEPAVSPAQIRSAAMLTEMLRSRYGIRAGNCVTHAQVSVNADNMRIGWHTDWASSFPFDKLGLPDNYGLPFPAVAAFGFEYDDNFVRLAGNRLVAGVQAAEEHLRDEAARYGASFESYRRALQKIYRERLARYSHGSPSEMEEAKDPGGQPVATPPPV